MIIAELIGAIVGNVVVAGERDHVHFNNSVGMVAIDPTWFTPAETIVARIERFVEYVRDANLVSGLSLGAAATNADGKVLLPGEAEHRSERAVERSGLDLSAETVADLNACGRAVDCGRLRVQ